jgi:hypothetical protein
MSPPASRSQSATSSFSRCARFSSSAYAWDTDPVTLLALCMVFSVPFFVAAAQ